MPNALLDQALNSLPEILTRDLERNLCVCNEVPRVKIIQAIAEGADTLEKVCAKTYATDGNGCCKRQVSRLLECLVDQTNGTSVTHSNDIHRG